MARTFPRDEKKQKKENLANLDYFGGHPRPLLGTSALFGHTISLELNNFYVAAIYLYYIYGPQQ